MSDKLTRLARGQDCEIRIPGVCNFNPETTVPCHVRMMDISGIGYKVPNFMIAFGCSACHQYADTHHDAETKAAFYEGVFRTQYKLHKLGAL